MSLISLILKILYISFFLTTSVYSEIVEKIVINGNKRISNETVIMFSKISLKDQISNKKLNLILKDLYETNYFEGVAYFFARFIALLTFYFIDLLIKQRRELTQ